MRPVSTRSRSRSATSCTGPRSLPPSCRSPRRAPCRPAPTPAAEKERGKRSEGTVCSLLLLSASRPFGRTGEALCGSEPQSGSSPARAPCEAGEPTRERENLTRERPRRLVALSHKADSSDARLRGLREHGRRAEALEDRLTLAERRGLSSAAEPEQGVRALDDTPVALPALRGIAVELGRFLDATTCFCDGGTRCPARGAVPGRRVLRALEKGLSQLELSRRRCDANRPREADRAKRQRIGPCHV